MDRFKVKIVIVSDLNDKVWADTMSSAMRHKPLNLSGKTSLSELAAILKRASLFISNDSGPVHVASALGTPVISIFGRIDRGLSPLRWGPIGKNAIVLHKDVGCQWCLAHNCGDGFRCLQAITIDEVLKAAQKLLLA